MNPQSSSVINRFPTLLHVLRRLRLRSGALRQPTANSLEALECRIAPAGVVNVSFTGKALLITGDAADNDLTLTQNAQDLITITGNNGTQVSLNGAAAQAAVTLPKPVLGGVTAKLLDGADVLTVDGVDLPGFLSVQGGNGAAVGNGGNTVTLRNVNVKTNVLITNLNGFDRTNFEGLVVVGGGVTINNGNGAPNGNGCNIQDNATTDLRIAGAFTILNRVGADSIELGDAANIAVGRIIVSNGADNNPNTVDFSPAGNLTVATTVRVACGSNFDFVRIGAGNTAHIGGGVGIIDGSGDSDVRIFGDNGLATGSIGILNGKGNDTVSIDSVSGPVTVLGRVRIINADGNSDTTLSSSTGLYLGGAVAIANGVGLDNTHIGTSSAPTTI